MLLSALLVSTYIIITLRSLYFLHSESGLVTGPGTLFRSMRRVRTEGSRAIRASISSTAGVDPTNDGDGGTILDGLEEGGKVDRLPQRLKREGAMERDAVTEGHTTYSSVSPRGEAKN